MDSEASRAETAVGAEADLPPEALVDHDLVLVGGRVIDPESGLDAIRNVGVLGGRIAAVTVAPLRGRRIHDVAGMVVTAGWIDMHSHAQSVAGSRLQAHDGVTTALDLEGGLPDVAGHYAAAAAEGRATNYGFSTSWQQARMVEVGRLPSGRLVDVLGHFGDPAWKQPANRRQLDRMVERFRTDIDNGAIGIGVLIGYAPEVDPAEYRMVSRVAESTGTATFTHARDLVEDRPNAVVDGAEEIVATAQETGARSHYCHINSTSLWHIDRVHRLIDSSPAAVSTEAYPYGAAATAISADFLSPDRLHEHRLTPQKLTYTRTGLPVRDVQELAHLQATDPGAVAIVHYLDENQPEDRVHLDRALSFPGAVVGSDAMPLTWAENESDPYAWPPPSSTVAHPRGAGTFSRVFRRYVRELRSMTLHEAIIRCSLQPARLLEDFVPAMARKGRVQVGCDADLVGVRPRSRRRPGHLQPRNVDLDRLRVRHRRRFRGRSVRRAGTGRAVRLGDSK